VVETLAKLDRAFDELRYDEMADAIYHFVWGTFCDWYLVMLHPLMPFITEELWSAMGERPYELIVAKWPMPQAQLDPRGGGRDRVADPAGERRSARAHGAQRAARSATFRFTSARRRRKPRRGCGGICRRSGGWPGSRP
jgi:isoleucyl-tRNA synthetase